MGDDSTNYTEKWDWAIVRQNIGLSRFPECTCNEPLITAHLTWLFSLWLCFLLSQQVQFWHLFSHSISSYIVPCFIWTNVREILHKISSLIHYVVSTSCVTCCDQWESERAPLVKEYALSEVQLSFERIQYMNFWQKNTCIDVTSFFDFIIFW